MFSKPQPLKAALKLGIYGPAGSGKTFTSLLIAEGLARHGGKRVAYVDTEQGTAFYGQAVPARAAHPEAFDFDVLHSRSIFEVLTALRDLDPAHHGVVVIDSITHLWDSCKDVYAGKLTRHGSIPLHAWAAIKKPYKDLLHLLLSSPAHLMICGRQQVDYGADEATGELKNLGFRMRAEGETAYEPDVLVRLEAHKTGPKQPAVPLAHVEKDRTGILAGKTIEWPDYDRIAQPLLGLLGPTQTVSPTDEEVGLQDAEGLAREGRERAQRSEELATEYLERFGSAETGGDLERAGRDLTAAVKARFTPRDLQRVRQAYAVRRAQLAPADQNGRPARAG
jgi:AAA domain